MLIRYSSLFLLYIQQTVNIVYKLLPISVRKRSLPIIIVFASILPITVFYIGFDKDHYNTVVSNYKFHPVYHRNPLSSVRICCLILTSPKNFLTFTKAVNETWGPHCDRYFFITDYAEQNMTSEQMNIGKQLPIASIKNITAGYDHLTQKSTLAFLFAYENYFNDCNWFVKADDDAFLIVENLKAFLSKQNASEPVTFGYHLKVILKKGYHSGGASYVLSRESLRRFYDAHRDPASRCRKDGGNEDAEIAGCLRRKGVYIGKSLDKQNRELFHPLTFADHFRGPVPKWLVSNSENSTQNHYICCSDQTISFHYVNPAEQYLMNFFLYRAQLTSNIKQGLIDKLKSSSTLVK